MNRRKICSTNEVLRRFVQQAESFNRSMFPRKSSTPISNQIVENLLDFSSSSIVKKKSTDFNDEILLVDVISSEYREKSSSFELNSIQSCCVVSIVSPSAFSIELTKDLADSDAFFHSMNDFYNSIDDLQIPIEYFRPNLLCVTWDEKSSTWNRGQMLEFDLIDETANIFYVDLNFWEEHVSRSRLRFILTKYSSRPVDLFTCCLASIGPTSDDELWNDVELKTFRNVIENYRCDVEFIDRASDGTFLVNLFASHDETYVCVNEFLLHCQMARRIDDFPSKNDRQINRIISIYWKSGESTKRFSSLTKRISIDTETEVILAKYRSLILVPSFTILSLIRNLDEKKLCEFAETFGFKTIFIDPLSDPLLCSQLLKFDSSKKKISTRISLFSIDFLRKILEKYSKISSKFLELFQRVKTAEAIGDETFWKNVD